MNDETEALSNAWDDLWNYCRNLLDTWEEDAAEVEELERIYAL